MTEGTGNYAGDSSSRLDRIETLLLQATERLEQTTERLDHIAESNEMAVARLTRIETLQERTQQQVDSNARAIQAWGGRIDEGIIETEEIATATRADLAERIRSVQQEWNQRFDELSGQIRLILQRLSGNGGEG